MIVAPSAPRPRDISSALVRRIAAFSGDRAEGKYFSLPFPSRTTPERSRGATPRPLAARYRLSTRAPRSSFPQGQGGGDVLPPPALPPNPQPPSLVSGGAS